MKKKPILVKILQTYSAAFFLFGLVCMTIIAATFSHTIEKQVVDVQKSVAGMAATNIEKYFDEMNEFSRTLAVDSEFKDLLINQLIAGKDNGTQTDIIRRIYSRAYHGLQKDYYISAVVNGKYYLFLRDYILFEKLSSDPALYEPYEMQGRPVVMLQQSEPYLQAVNAGNLHIPQDNVIVLARGISMRPFFAQPQAILELKVRQTEFAQFMEKMSLELAGPGMRISVFGTGGCLLYGNENLSPQDVEQTGEWERHKDTMLLKHSVLQDEVTLLFEIPVNIYYDQLYKQMIFILLGMFGMLVGLLVIGYAVSRSLSHPLHILARQAGSLDLAKPGAFQPLHTDIQEISALSETLMSMQSKLNSSLDEIVRFQTAEVQARFMALQSQIQPHFMYNTLASVRALCESGRPQDAASMCDALSRMLHYMSAKADTGVQMHEEIAFLLDYGQIMKKRFVDSQIQLDIPFEMYELRVPKLILQPLCENSYKYVQRADVQIQVRGYIEDGFWYLEVADNGAGFSQQQAQELLERCRTYAEQSRSLGARINGMGLVNIYARLALFYRDAFVFRILPHEKIVIGGKISDGVPDADCDRGR